MQQTKLLFIPVLFVMGLLLSGCSDDPAGNTNYAMGNVTKLGSVYVNGVRYDTSGANITLDDANATESEVLDRPVVVSANSANVASSVKAETVIKGKVDSVTTTGISWVIMGQTVRLADGGTLSGTPIASDLVEVSGLVKPGGVVVATIVEEKTALTVYKIKGYISSVDTTAQTFVIGGKTINYASANTSDLGGAPAVDMLVEVKADADASPLVATVVEKYGPGVTSASHIEVEGYVKGLSGTHPDLTFTVSGVDVTTSSNTTFEVGDNAYLANNSKVEVEGSMSGGTLTASKVKLKDSVRAEGNITMTGSNTFTIDNLSGISFTVDSNTEYNSDTNDALSDFTTGKHVRLRGVPTGATAVLVTRLDERNADTKVYLRGPVSTEAGNNVTVMGITVDVTTVTRHNLDDTAIDAAAFLSAVVVGTPVKITDDVGGSGWDTIELED